MLFKNVHINSIAALQQISMANGKITAVEGTDNSTNDRTVWFDDAIAFPGLINSHDHLDFNLFPRLGNGIYNNYKEWAKDIHITNNEAITAILNVPKALRVQWGVYKNLICGVTTVAEHGEKIDTVPGNIAVHQDCHALHSVAFEKNWRWKLNNPFAKHKTVVVHIGEGTDAASQKEISNFIYSNFFKRRTVAVHGVAMTEEQAEHFAALVWCPDTNYTLLGKTAPVDRLKHRLPVLFGTDSTLTSHWNIWQQLRIARDSQLVNEEELFDMVTKNPAAVWKLHAGSIAPGMQADVVVAKRNGKSFFDIDPRDILLVVRKGEIQLFDALLQQQLTGCGIAQDAFSRISIDGIPKYVKGDVPALIKEIKRYYPAATFPIQVDS